MLHPNKPRFSGFLLQETSFGGVMPPEEQERLRRTFARTALIVLCLFGLLFLRLWFLQLLQGEEMQAAFGTQPDSPFRPAALAGHDSGPPGPGAGGQPAQL